MADFGRDPYSGDSLRGSRNCFFRHPNNARFHRFFVLSILLIKTVLTFIPREMLHKFTNITHRAVPLR